jgi:hypothetical protein
MRHRVRSVYQSIYDHLGDQLGVLGWLTAGGAKTTPVTMQQYVPDETGQSLQPNTVAVTLGDESGENAEELGDRLVSVDLQLFVDIYGENQAITLAIADDVKDILRGRINGLSRFVPAYDYTGYDGTPESRTPVDDEIEMLNVGRQPAKAVELRRNWQVVYATANVLYVPDQYLETG